MRVNKLESKVKLECDECGKLTKRLYVIVGESYDYEEGWGLHICRACYSLLRQKIESAIDEYKRRRLKKLKDDKFNENVDPKVTEMHKSN